MMVVRKDVYHPKIMLVLGALLIASVPGCAASPHDDAIGAATAASAVPQRGWRAGQDECETIQRWHEALNRRFTKRLLDQQVAPAGIALRPQAYFDVLDHLSAPEAKALDYVYWYNGFSGRPILYWRDRSQQPFDNYAEYETSMGGEEAVIQKSRNVYLEIRADGTARSYLQMVIFRIHAGQVLLSRISHMT